MSEQIDIAVDLGVIPPPLPEILSLRQLVELATTPPPLRIEGISHQGCKMVLGGTSKSNKSWFMQSVSVSGLKLIHFCSDRLIHRFAERGEEVLLSKHWPFQ